MLVVVLVCALAVKWPDPCPGGHPSEATYAVAVRRYNAIVQNHTATRQKEYNTAVQKYRTSGPPYERAKQAIDNRFWNLLLLRGTVKQPARHIQPTFSAKQLGHYDENLYWEAIRALGPPPVQPAYKPGKPPVPIDLIATLTAHKMRADAWRAPVFDETSAILLFGNLPRYNTRLLTATRDAFVIMHTCGIPSRAAFTQLLDLV
jgi:hypothetical protein